MSFADAQGSTVTFGGQALGSLVNVQGTVSVSGKFDCTSLLSPVIGAGANSRVLMQTNPTSIDGGSVVIQFLGPTVFSRRDMGRVAELSFSVPSGGALNGLAYLDNIEIEAAVGEKLRGTATFTFTNFFA